MPAKSTSVVTNAARHGRPKDVRRDTLVIGDLFQRKNGRGRVYMHTGCRTAPPSGRTLTCEFNGSKQNIELFKKCGVQGGKDIIGFQAIVVEGDVDEGEDGAAVTYDGAALVTWVGRAEITLKRVD